MPAGISKRWQEVREGKRKRSSNLREQVQEPSDVGDANSAGGAINPDKQEHDLEWVDLTGRQKETDKNRRPSDNVADTSGKRPQGRTKEPAVGSEEYRSNLSEAARTSENSGQLNPTWVEWLMGRSATQN